MQTGIDSYEDTSVDLCESKDEATNKGDSSKVAEFSKSQRERKLTEKGRDYLLELKTNIYKQTKSCLTGKLLYLKSEVNSIDTTSLACEIEQLETLVKDFNHVSDELLKLLQPIQRESYIRECQAILGDWNDLKASGLTKHHRFRMRKNPSLPHLFGEKNTSSRKSSGASE